MANVVPGTTRNTRQRAEVLALLDGTDSFRSAQQLHADLRAKGARVGLTTVYRTLQLLVEAGEIDLLRMPSGEQLFRRCGSHRPHHHHLVCRNCGRTVEVVGPGIGAWATKQATKHGFTEIEHILEIIGTCASCAERVDQGCDGNGRTADHALSTPGDAEPIELS